MGTFPGGNIIRVTPTCTTDALGSAGDVIFNSAEIPNAVSNRGGVSMLLGCYVIDYTDATNDLNIVLHETNGINIGPTDSSATMNISDANMRLLKFIGRLQIDAADTDFDMGGLKVLYAGNVNANTTADGVESPVSPYPMLLQAAGGSTSVYFSAATGTAETFATDSLEFIFHIKYLG
ncbi:MAG: hypothetical protein ACR2L5_01520 [Candidatus Actinomarinaceae bacterium]